MADVLHDPNVLPDDLPAPQDDGAARHLVGMKLPDIALAATDGTEVRLSTLKGRTIVYVYPRTGRPGQAHVGSHPRRPRGRHRRQAWRPSTGAGSDRRVEGPDRKR